MAAPAVGVPAVRVASRLKLGATFFPDSSTSSDQSTRGSRYRRRRGPAGPPPAMMAEVRVVIRRHFPVPAVFVGRDGGVITRTAGAEKVVVSEDIALRRRRSRALLTPERVERALAEDVLPLIRHKYDRGAVAAASGEICAYVSATCADQRLARAGVHILVIVDTFVCPPPTVLFRVAPIVPPCKRIVPMPTTASGGAMKRIVVKKPAAGPCMELESRRMPPVMKETRRSSAAIVGDGTIMADSNPCMELKSGMPPAPAKQGTTTRPSVGVIGDGRPPKPVEERFKGWLP